MQEGQKHWGDKVCKITVQLENSSKVVNFLLNVVLHVDDPSGPVVETSHHTSFHVGQNGGISPCMCMVFQ